MDIGKIQRICQAPEASFARRGASLLDDNILIHLDTGASVLGVAHLDTRFSENHFYHSCDNKRMVWSPRLDNRLGVYILLELLPSMGIETDVLLTTDNLKGTSTASEYFGAREYNWMFSFDMPGTGVAMYNFETLKMPDILRPHGLRLIGGSPDADITKLWFLGIAGFNIGNGIVFNDSLFSGALLPVTKKMVNCFASFYEEHSGTLLEYDPSPDDIYAIRQGYDIYEQPSIDEFDFAGMGDSLCSCDFCGHAFPANEIVHAPMIGDGAFLCKGCLSLQEIGYLI